MEVHCLALFVTIVPLPMECGVTELNRLLSLYRGNGA